MSQDKQILNTHIQNLIQPRKIMLPSNTDDKKP